MAEYVKKEVLIDKLLHIAEDFERHGGLIDTAFAVATKSLIEIFEDEKCSIFEEIGNEWISVKDRLPEGYKDVLVCDEIYGCFIAFYDKSHSVWYRKYRRALTGVTHWMPLPEPPKGE